MPVTDFSTAPHFKLYILIKNISIRRLGRTDHMGVRAMHGEPEGLSVWPSLGYLLQFWAKYTVQGVSVVSLNDPATLEGYDGQLMLMWELRQNKVREFV